MMFKILTNSSVLPESRLYNFWVARPIVWLTGVLNANLALSCQNQYRDLINTYVHPYVRLVSHVWRESQACRRRQSGLPERPLRRFL